MVGQTNTYSTARDAYDRNTETLDHENAAVNSSASYADLLLIDNRRNKELLISLLCSSANSFYYQILGSIDDATTQPASTDASYHVIVTDVSVAASGLADVSLVRPWKWVVVQIKNNSGVAVVTGRARGVA